MNKQNHRGLAAARVGLFAIAYVAALFAISVFSRFLPQIISTSGLLLLTVIVPPLLAIGWRVFWDRKPIVTLGLQPVRTWVAEAVAGFAVAAVLVVGIFATLGAGGWLTWRVHLAGRMTSPILIALIIYLFLAALLVAVSEEFVFRGYVLRTVLNDWGAPVGIAVSAVLFGLAHAFNPGFNWLVGVNLGLAGALMGYAAVVYKNLWWPIGFHLAWNFFEGPVLGMPVSGLSPLSVSLFSTKIDGPAWLVGGAFGPEGGVAATVALLLGVGWLWFLDRRRRAAGHA